MYSTPSSSTREITSCGLVLGWVLVVAISFL
jgi:hypothetical protein